MHIEVEPFVKAKSSLSISPLDFASKISDSSSTGVSSGTKQLFSKTLLIFSCICSNKISFSGGNSQKPANFRGVISLDSFIITPKNI